VIIAERELSPLAQSRASLGNAALDRAEAFSALSTTRAAEPCKPPIHIHAKETLLLVPHVIETDVVF
jgi:hypothetical protein